MKKKENPIVIAIIALLIILAIIIYLYVSPNKTNSINTSSNETSENLTEIVVNRQNIENTLSSSGQVSSALDEKLYLHSSYYFSELLVQKNVFIAEGTNIIKYTNGTYLTAPYDCVVIETSLPEDESAVCTSSHYIEINSVNTLSMSLNVNESDINKVEIGDEVDITITATAEKLTGHITSISEVGTYSSSGSYFTANVEFENSGNVKVGMSATCEIIIEKAENVIAVPIEAIQESDNGKYVIVVNSDGSTSNTNVETGISNDAYIEIKSGLSGGEKIQMEESTSSNNSVFPSGGNMGRGSGNGGADFPKDMDIQIPSGMPGGPQN